jgi:hypothetical protein
MVQVWSSIDRHEGKRAAEADVGCCGGTDLQTLTSLRRGADCWAVQPSGSIASRTQREAALRTRPRANRHFSWEANSQRLALSKTTFDSIAADRKCSGLGKSFECAGWLRDTVFPYRHSS